MATILKARGRMTKDLVTPFDVGDQVVTLVGERQRYGRVRVGEIGTIKRVIISAPNDGDATFLMFYVKARRGTVLLLASEFAPVEVGAQELHALQEAHAPRPRRADAEWLKKVLDDLNDTNNEEGK